MLYRTIHQDLICITQPAHAWVSGQLARAWGNETFGSFSPHEDVCLAAEQHDIGWLHWETEPSFNPKTGRPHSFAELRLDEHVKLWTGAKHLAMPFGRYVALLVSLHGTGLYERFTAWKKSPESTRIVQKFLSQEKDFQRYLIAGLQQNSHYQSYVSPAAIASQACEGMARNQRLVAIWDSLSLALCMGMSQEQQFERVPTATGETTLKLTPIKGDPTEIAVEPWCFQTEIVTLVFEGRILTETAADEITMRQQLVAAPWVTITTTLHPW